MKRTFTINLCGKIFHIDEDAYQLLNSYLSNLRITFSGDDGDEIITDIEGRICELFTEKLQNGNQVITLNNVNEVIDIMGQPEQLSDDATKTQSSSQPPELPDPPQPSLNKKLFRDPDGKELGGVFSGLSYYLGCNVTILRLAAILLALCGFGTIIVFYIIAWIIVPEAKNAEEKLQMRGAPINLDNIGQTVKNGFAKAGNDINDFMTRNSGNAWEKLGNLIGILAKCALAFMAIVAIPVAFAMLVALVATLSTLIAICISGVDAVVAAVPGLVIPSDYMSGLPLCICIFIAFFIPACALIWTACTVLFKSRPASRAMLTTAIILEITAIIASVILFSINHFSIPDFYISN